MRLKSRHHILRHLERFGETLREKNVGIMINAAGDIGHSCAILGLEAGLPIVAINEPAKGVDEIRLAMALGADHDADIVPVKGGIQYGPEFVQFMKTFEPWTVDLQHKGPVVVLNCAGVGFDNATCDKFQGSWANAVILSGPPDDSDIPLALHGVTADEVVVEGMTRCSMGSCTTNSAARGVIALNDKFTISGGTMETVHSATNSNGACDSWGMGPGILDAIALPGGSGALKLLGSIVPALKGVFVGGSIRVPVADGSITSLTLFTSQCGVTKEQVNEVLESCAPANDPFFGVNASANPPVTIGMVRSTYYLALYDLASTKVVNMGDRGSLIQVHFGYSNKWGFSFGMLGLAAKWAKAQD